MDTASIANKGLEASAVAAGNVCRIVVVYEDLAAHHRAMELGTRLASGFRDEPAFIFRSWDFKDLGEPAASADAIEAAADADILLFSIHGNDMPWAVTRWVEACVQARGRRDGALAVLLAEPFCLSPSSGSMLIWLENAARRLSMDYVPLIPEPAEQMIKTLHARAQSVIAMLEDVLPGRPAFENWGLNE